jgi:hypothetical protein
MLAVLGWFAAACAERQPRPDAPSHEPIVFPIELEGPSCPSDGPAVEVLQAHRFSCGKGDTCTMLDERIRNPTDRPIWLLLDQYTVFSQSLESVTLLRSRFDGRAIVWGFDGQNYDTLFRVPSRSDVIARHLEYTRPLRQLRAVFLDRISLSRAPDVGAMAPEASIPKQGEFDAQRMNGFMGDYDVRVLAQFKPRESVSVEVRCVLEAPVTIEAAGTTQ